MAKAESIKLMRLACQLSGYQPEINVKIMKGRKLKMRK
jgi:hypothetical protein